MNEKAHSIFQTAQMYAKAARFLNGISNNDPSMLLPSTINAALSLELYFKSLYVLERNADFKINGRHSHDFSVLFEELSESTKQSFTEGFNNALAVRDMNDVKIMESRFAILVPRDLKSNLVEWSTVFTGVRYVYDFVVKSKGTQKTMMFFPEIEAVAIAIILQREPTWQQP